MLQLCNCHSMYTSDKRGRGSPVWYPWCNVMDCPAKYSCKKPDATFGMRSPINNEAVVTLRLDVRKRYTTTNHTLLMNFQHLIKPKHGIQIYVYRI